MAYRVYFINANSGREFSVDITSTTELVKKLNDVPEYVSEKENWKCYDSEILHCPLGGDEKDDCASCVHFDDYHFVNSECVER